jgi:hypothetical protein
LASSTPTGDTGTDAVIHRDLAAAEDIIGKCIAIINEQIFVYCGGISEQEEVTQASLY